MLGALLKIVTIVKGVIDAVRFLKEQAAERKRERDEKKRKESENASDN